MARANVFIFLDVGSWRHVEITERRFLADGNNNTGIVESIDGGTVTFDVGQLVLMDGESSRQLRINGLVRIGAARTVVDYFRGGTNTSPFLASYLLEQ